MKKLIWQSCEIPSRQFTGKTLVQELHNFSDVTNYAVIYKNNNKNKFMTFTVKPKLMKIINYETFSDIEAAKLFIEKIVCEKYKVLILTDKQANLI